MLCIMAKQWLLVYLVTMTQIKGIKSETLGQNHNLYSYQL
jgi:hypothetical protein